MNTDRHLRRLAADLFSDDPRTALLACRRLRTELPWLEQRAVSTARRAEWNWSGIARLLGITRQSVHRRFRHVDEWPQLRPAAAVGPGEATERRYHRNERDARLARELRSWEAATDEIVPW